LRKGPTTFDLVVRAYPVGVHVNTCDEKVVSLNNAESRTAAILAHPCSSCNPSLVCSFSIASNDLGSVASASHNESDICISQSTGWFSSAYVFVAVRVYRRHDDELVRLQKVDDVRVELSSLNQEMMSEIEQGRGSDPLMSES
jgi:hypothetical protein